jgi:predicted nucleic acid-binding Zn ribbon protein
MVEKVTQHRHCKSCDKAIPYKDEFCDETCEAAWKIKMQTKRRQLLYFYMAMVIIMIIAIVLGVFGGG